jgi:hypothetical protein
LEGPRLDIGVASNVARDGDDSPMTGSPSEGELIGGKEPDEVNTGAEFRNEKSGEVDPTGR